LALENAQAKKSNQRATSFFSRLPPDVLRIIAGFLAIDGQVFPGALEDVRVFLFNNPDLIAQNEIIVPLTEKAAWQGARKIRLNSVPSLERRCREYSLFKVNLSREDKAQQKYAFLEILLHKEFTADSEKKLAEYRARVLESYLQVSSFNVVEYLTKLESISDSEFYQDAKLENLDQLRLKKI
jgi:hypothetical protein